MSRHSCICHRSLWWWIQTAWRIRGQLPFPIGLKASVSCWYTNRKDRH